MNTWESWSWFIKSKFIHPTWIASNIRSCWLPKTSSLQDTVKEKPVSRSLARHTYWKHVLCLRTVHSCMGIYPEEGNQAVLRSSLCCSQTLEEDPGADAASLIVATVLLSWFRWLWGIRSGRGRAEQSNICITATIKNQAMGANKMSLWWTSNSIYTRTGQKYYIIWVIHIGHSLVCVV